MPDPLWKQTERRIARYFGGIRISAPYLKGVDVLTDWLHIEIRDRRRLPQWLIDALLFSQAHTDNGRLGVVVAREKGSRDDLVVMSLPDFQKWFGPLHRKVGA